MAKGLVWDVWVSRALPCLRPVGVGVDASGACRSFAIEAAWGLAACVRAGAPPFVVVV